MGWFTRFQMRRAARAMARKLPPLIAREWGRADHYTPQQVRRALQITALTGRFDFVALAAFLSREDYEAVRAVESIQYDYDAARELFEQQLPGGFAGTYWQNPMSNEAAASGYGIGGLP
jgi:hypothetical protein